MVLVSHINIFKAGKERHLKKAEKTSMRILMNTMIGIKSRINSFVMVLATNVIKARESSKTLITNMTRVIRVDIKIAILVWGIYILIIYIGYKMGYDITDNIAYLEGNFSTLKAVEEPIKVLLISFQDGVAKTIWLDMYPSDTLNLVKATSMEFARMCITDGSRIVCSMGHAIVDTTSGESIDVHKIAEAICRNQRDLELEKIFLRIHGIVFILICRIIFR